MFQLCYRFLAIPDYRFLQIFFVKQNFNRRIEWNWFLFFYNHNKCGFSNCFSLASQALNFSGCIYFYLSFTFITRGVFTKLDHHLSFLAYFLREHRRGVLAIPVFAEPAVVPVPRTVIPVQVANVQVVNLMTVNRTPEVDVAGIAIFIFLPVFGD